MWEAFSSPIISDSTRRTSVGVRAPATSGANRARTAGQSRPCMAGSWKWSASVRHAWSKATRLSRSKLTSISAETRHVADRVAVAGGGRGDRAGPGRDGHVPHPAALAEVELGCRPWGRGRTAGPTSRRPWPSAGGRRGSRRAGRAGTGRGSSLPPAAPTTAACLPSGLTVTSPRRRRPAAGPAAGRCRRRRPPCGRADSSGRSSGDWWPRCDVGRVGRVGRVVAGRLPRVGRLGRGAGGPLAEQVGELVGAERRRPRLEVDAGQLEVLGPLAGPEQDGRPVRRPGGGRALGVGDERRLPRRPAGGGHEVHVVEPLGPGRDDRDEVPGRGPRQRPPAAERRLGQRQAAGQQSVTVGPRRGRQTGRGGRRPRGRAAAAAGGQVDDPQLAAVADEGHGRVVGGEGRGGVVRRRVGQPGLGLGGEVVQVDVPWPRRGCWRRPGGGRRWPR